MKNFNVSRGWVGRDPTIWMDQNNSERPAHVCQSCCAPIGHHIVLNFLSNSPDMSQVCDGWCCSKIDCRRMRLFFCCLWIESHVNLPKQGSLSWWKMLASWHFHDVLLPRWRATWSAPFVTWHEVILHTTAEEVDMESSWHLIASMRKGTGCSTSALADIPQLHTTSSWFQLECWMKTLFWVLTDFVLKPLADRRRRSASLAASLDLGLVILSWKPSGPKICWYLWLWNNRHSKCQVFSYCSVGTRRIDGRGPKYIF